MVTGTGVRKSGITKDRYTPDDIYSSYSIMIVPAYEGEFLGKFVSGKTLNEVLLEQQNQIEKLRARISRLEKLIKNNKIDG